MFIFYIHEHCHPLWDYDKTFQQTIFSVNLLIIMGQHKYTHTSLETRLDEDFNSPLTHLLEVVQEF